jgi:hypothetical protein
MQFTLLWPTGQQTYRIPRNGVRTVPTEGSAEPTLLSEAPAAFGLGPPGEVSITASPLIPGITRLFIHNAHDSYALVKLVVWCFPGDPSPSVHAFFGVLAPHLDTYVIDVPADADHRYEIHSLVAEDDPGLLRDFSEAKRQALASALRPDAIWYAACETGHPFWAGPNHAGYADASADAVAHDESTHNGEATAVVINS